MRYPRGVAKGGMKRDMVLFTEPCENVPRFQARLQKPPLSSDHGSGGDRRMHSRFFYRFILRALTLLE